MMTNDSLRQIVCSLGEQLRDGTEEALAWIPVCKLCALESAGDPVSSEHAFSLPDKYPVAQGHTIVVPRAHSRSFFDLREDQQADAWRLVAAVRLRLIEEGGCDSFTIGINDGGAAGQTVPHAHVHVIPRRPGDVVDPKGGVRWIIPDGAKEWQTGGSSSS